MNLWNCLKTYKGETLKHWVLIGCLLVAGSLTGCQNCRTLPPASGTAVYVIIGQSLAGGFFDTPMTDTPDKRIQFYKHGSWEIGQEPSSDDPASVYTSAMPFAKQMLSQNPSTPIGIVNCARGSTTLDEWMPNSCANNPNLPQCNLFEACQAKVSSALASLPGSSVSGVLYNEGQSLAHECQMGYWPSVFPQLAASFQSVWGDIPVVFSQLGSLAEECGAGYLESTRAHQASIKAHKVFMVSTLDLGTTDGVHMDTVGHQVEGQRWASVMYQGQGMKECTDPWWGRIIR